MRNEKSGTSNYGKLVLQRKWLLALVVVATDRLTKFVVFHAFPPILVKNTGTVFGLFGQNNFFWLIVSVMLLAALLFYILKLRAGTKSQKLTSFCVLLILSGGIANVIDRLLYGYVIDFIKLPFWPAFNVADVAVTVGLTVLIWQTLFGKDRIRKLES